MGPGIGATASRCNAHGDGVRAKNPEGPIWGGLGAVWREGQCRSAQGIQRSTWAAWYGNGSSPLGRDCWRLEGGRQRARRTAGRRRAAQSSEHTVVIGGGRDPGGAGGARQPSNVDRSITAVDHPAIGERAHIGAQKHGSQIQRPY